MNLTPESLWKFFQEFVHGKPEFSAPLVIESDDPVEFATSPGMEGRATWVGKLFEEGDYGPKGKYDRAKIDALVASFPPSGVIVKDTHRKGHQEGFLDLLMRADQTRVARVWASDAPNGKRVIEGEFDAPLWLDHAAKKASATKRVSIGLTQDREAIEEVSLCINPHVADAAVFERETAAAFAATPAFSAFAAAHPDDARLVTEAAKAPDPAPPMPLNKEQLWAQFSAIPGNEGKRAEFDALFANAPTTPDPTDPKPSPDVEARFKKTQEQIDALGATFAAQQDADDALTTFTALVKEGYKAPADRDAFLATFKKARKADRDTATFTADGGGDCVSALVEAVKSGPKRFSGIGKTGITSRDNLDPAAFAGGSYFDPADLDAALGKEAK